MTPPDIADPSTAAALDTMEAERPETPAGDAGPRGARADRIWIAWEEQRRTLNLSGRVGAALHLCLDEKRGWLRYPLSISKTMRLLAGQRGRTVFVQNPSMVLAALACLLKKPFGYRLIVDRHSNFAFLAAGRAGLKRRLSDLLSAYTLRNADMTVVTNPELAARVAETGGWAFVLPDPFPDLSAFADVLDPRGKHAGLPGPGGPAGREPGRPLEILFVSSWAFDEPIAETIEACRRLRGEAVVRITGRMKPEFAALVSAAPDNFVPTGFLGDREYFALMARCDAVMAVTRRAATLVCGGYEAAVMGKPLILGDSAALRDYFNAGAVYTDGTSADLEERIRGLAADLPAHAEGIARFHAQRSREWDGKLAALEARLRAFNPGLDCIRAPGG